MPVNIASTLAAIDTEIATYYQDILDMEASYYVSNGEYAQGLPTHNNYPEDGNGTAPDRLTESPSDQSESWNDLVTLPSTLKAALRIGVYETSGGWGYIAIFLATINGVVWEKCIDEGDSGKDRTWGPQSTDSWEDGVVSHWPFDETSGTRFDLVDDNNFAIYNTPHYTPDGVFDNAIWFQCDSSENAKAQMVAELANDSSWTFVGWLYLRDNGSNEQEIFRLLNSAEATIGTFFYKLDQNGDGFWEWWLFWNGLGCNYEDFGFARWYFVELYYDATTQKLGLTIDNGPAYEASTTYQADVITQVALGGTDSAGADIQTDQWRFLNRRLTRSETQSLFEEPQGLAAQTIEDSLRSAWHLDEVSGTRYDSISSYDLTETGTPDRVVGVAGYGANFNAADGERLEANVGSIDWSSDWSLCMWLKLECVAGQDSWCIRSGSTDCGFITYDVVAEEIYLTYGIAAQDPLYAHNNHQYFQSDEWHWVYWQYDATANEIGVCVDNGPLKTRSHVGPLPNPNKMRLGALDSSEDDCTIDAEHWWSKLLTQAEREYLYNKSAGRELE